MPQFAQKNASKYNRNAKTPEQQRFWTEAANAALNCGWSGKRAIMFANEALAEQFPTRGRRATQETTNAG